MIEWLKTLLSLQEGLDTITGQRARSNNNKLVEANIQGQIEKNCYCLTNLQNQRYKCQKTSQGPLTLTGPTPGSILLKMIVDNIKVRILEQYNSILKKKNFSNKYPKTCDNRYF